MSKGPKKRGAAIRNARDTGDLAVSAAVLEGLRFEHSALSVAGKGKRSTFRDCEFRNLEGRGNVVGTPVFERCTFEGIISRDHLGLYAALFLECTVRHVLAGVTFGFDGQDVYPAAVIEYNIQAASKAPYCLDVTGADLKDVGFSGPEIAARVRFRPGQCLILSSPELAQRSLPIVQGTENEAFAELLSSAASFSEHKINLAVVPQELKRDLPRWIKEIEVAGVEVLTTPLC